MGSPGRRAAVAGCGRRYRAREQLDDERDGGRRRRGVDAARPEGARGWESLRRSFDRSIADLAALRMRTGEYRRPLFAAGMPWFMTVFGRDTAITSLQTLLLGPEIAVGAARCAHRPPGAGRGSGHRCRAGEDRARGAAAAARRPGFPATTARSTPRRSSSSSSPRRGADRRRGAREAASRAGVAGARVDRPLWRSRRRRLRRIQQARRSRPREPVLEGLGDSQRFHDGRFADRRSPRSRCRATCTTPSGAGRARAGSGGSFARRRLDREADELQRRFDEAFWVEERGGYALALDGKKRPVDARCSNMGHLLWSGIAPPSESDRRSTSLSEGLWSGWGIRTMASDAAAYNPISYHNGTVWPHDSALAVWGLLVTATWPRLAASRGPSSRPRRTSTGRFRRCSPATPGTRRRSRSHTPRLRPQAWAAGTPILLVRVLLGIEPDRLRQRLISTVTDELPSWLDGLRIEGVRAYGRTWTVAVERGHVTIAEA